MMVSLESGPFGCYTVETDDGRSVLIQVDWDYPGVASNLGWSPCHGDTDGTIDCPVCGRTATDMIADAAEFLDDHIGESFEDPGYFGEG